MGIGKSILSIRQQKGMTQREVSARSELAISYISRIENDRVQPTMATLGRLAEALEVPVSTIFRIGERGSAPPVHRCPVSASGECIGEQIRNTTGRPARGRLRDPYGREELALLRMTNDVALHGSKDARRALRVLLESLVLRDGNAARPAR